MTAEKCHEISVRLNMDLLHFVGHDDLNFADFIRKGFPDVCNCYPVTLLQLVDVQKVMGTVPASVAGNDRIGIFATDWDTGLTHNGGTVGHVLTRGP